MLYKVEIVKVLMSPVVNDNLKAINPYHPLMIDPNENIFTILKWLQKIEKCIKRRTKKL